LQAKTMRRSECSLPDNSELVFTSPAGHPIYSDKLAKRFKAILGQNGSPIIRLYDLRHTAATLALSAGVPPKVVAEQLGHASAAFTLDVYSHLLPHMQEEAAIKVEQILAGPGLLPHRMAGQKRFPKTGRKKPPKAVNSVREGRRTRLRA
jgi:integrase